LTKSESETVHGVNERLSFENAARIVGFMIEVIQRLSSLEVDSIDDTDDEMDEEDLSAEERAIRELETPLPTRPMRKPPVTEEPPLPAPSEEWEALPEDDEPLEVKPMRKK
jgi:hypothetical protein